jgi:hypothetical protein
VALQTTAIVAGHSYTMHIGTTVSAKNVMTISSWTIS